jgi:hypothetical protein
MSRRIVGGAVAAVSALAFAVPAGATTPSNPSCEGSISNNGQVSAVVLSFVGSLGPGLSWAGPQGVSTEVHLVDCPAGK